MMFINLFCIMISQFSEPRISCRDIPHADRLKENFES